MVKRVYRVRHFILSSLSVLLFSTATVSVVHAQTTSAPAPNASSTSVELTPFDLVSLAYQGFLESEGVPKFNRLIFEYRVGRFEAEELVRAAIATRRVPADTINDRRYLTAVERQLDDLVNSTSN